MDGMANRELVAIYSRAIAEGLSPSDAYRRLPGRSKVSDKAAKRNGYAWLRRSDVQAEIARLRKQADAVAALSLAALDQRLASLALGDTAFLSKLKNLNDFNGLAPEERALVKAIEVDDEGMVRRVQLVDTLRALELAYRRLGLASDAQQTVTVSVVGLSDV